MYLSAETKSFIACAAVKYIFFFALSDLSTLAIQVALKDIFAAMACSLTISRLAACRGISGFMIIFAIIVSIYDDLYHITQNLMR